MNYAQQIRPGPRPKVKQVHRLGVNAVLTLLKLNEQPGLVQEACAKAQMIWVHSPLDCQRDSMSPKEEWQDALDMLDALVSEELTVYVHCAQGIHRTGCLLYLFYRNRGMTHDQAWLHLIHHMPHVKGKIENKVDELRLMFNIN